MRHALVLGLFILGCGGGTGGGGSGGTTGAGGAGGANVAQLPMVTINHPGDGETRSASEAVPFVGTADDPQDATLTGSALVWTSDRLTQPIGTGAQFSAALPVGDHVITLTATDPDSNKGTASITLHVR